LLDGFGGMMSFEVTGGVKAANHVLETVTLPISAPSLGGVESLITRPAATSHAGVPPEARKNMGISDSLIRLSVGLEATEDLIEDFEQALSHL
jgi:cystathionine beta-lyase/cystathionine gamma-synthase